MIRFNRFAFAVLFLLALTAAIDIDAQALYAVDESSDELWILDPARGAAIVSIGDLTPPDGIALGRGIAMDADSGVMYTVYEPTARGGGAYTLGTVDLATGTVTPIAVAERIRGLVFDGKGELWATTGGSTAGAPFHSLITVNTATGAVAVQNSSLPTIRNKIAYRAASDELFLLGYNSTALAWQLYSLSPSNPTNLTQITLSGDSLGGSTSQPPMVHDPSSDLILCNQGSDWLTISTTGVVTATADEGADNLGGLAWDPAAPAPTTLFSNGFETGSSHVWSDTVTPSIGP